MGSLKPIGLVGVFDETSKNEKPKFVDEKEKPKPNGITENLTQKQVQRSQHEIQYMKSLKS